MKRSEYRKSFFKGFLLCGAMLAALIAGCMIAVPIPANAGCGKLSKEAQTFCKTWKNSHPGDKCSAVRGYVCIAKVRK